MFLSVSRTVRKRSYLLFLVIAIVGIHRHPLVIVQVVPELVLAEDLSHVAEKTNLQIEHFDPDTREAFADKKYDQEDMDKICSYNLGSYRRGLCD